MIAVGRNSSVGSELGSLFCVMQRRGFEHSSEPPVEVIFPLELTWVLTLFPKTLSGQSINLGIVSAHMHFISRTKRS